MRDTLPSLIIYNSLDYLSPDESQALTTIWKQKEDDLFRFDVV